MCPSALFNPAEPSRKTIYQADMSEGSRPLWTPLLSVIIPVYNEVETIDELLRRVARTPFSKEILVVDDNSTDGTRELLRDLPDVTMLLDGRPLPAPCRVKALFHSTNQGKGQAVQTALHQVTGSFVLIQDADLEYSPSDYPQLLAPLLTGQADVVYGSRFLNSPACSSSWHTATNKVLTTVSNICTRLQLTDMETCYKAFRSEVLQGLTLRSKRLGFEPEITAKIARDGVRICEVPISYSPRTYAEGKKVRWQDGFVALWTILRCHMLEADKSVKV